MNKNIEIINKNLWAVKFSHLPYIEEIDIEPDALMPLEEEPGRIASGGLMILNKDYPGFNILKDFFPRLMKKKDKQIDKDLQNFRLRKTLTEWESLYHAMLQVEKERRIKERAVKN